MADAATADRWHSRRELVADARLGGLVTAVAKLVAARQARPLAQLRAVVHRRRRVDVGD